MKVYSISVNGKVYDVEVREKDATAQAPLKAAVSPAAVAAPAPKAAAKPAPQANSPAPAAAAGGSTVVAPMPGKIMDISVREGDAVSPNQALCILEAMKMENEIVAPAAGTVARIHVRIGDHVDTGDIMITIA